MSKPFFSIIVASYNAADTIKITIDSILKQNFEDYEIIVKDGGSSDATLENIPSYDKTKVYSSPDGGIYGGMNEGIGYSSGKYLCFLNCGDVFENENVLNSFYELAKDFTDSRRLLYGNYSRKKVVFKQPSKITGFYLYRTPLCHQSMFFGRDFFDEYGVYDTTFRILADYNHTLCAFKNNVPFIYCDVTVCDYLGGGASESTKGKAKKKQEYAILKNEYFTAAQIKKYDIKLSLSFKGLRQKMISDKAPIWVRKIYRFIVNIVNH